MAQGTYHLDLEPAKRNVFVTQLNDREDEEECRTTNHPVVKESAGKLLESGINTLQKTLLLKAEVEVDQVNAELEEKREEFRRRMEACAQRQIDIQKRQQKMKDRVEKFEKFIKENEAKRRRAIQKYQQEVKLKAQKDREHEGLCAQLQELKARNDILKKKLAKYEKYKNYLLEVIDILPANYLEVQDSMLNSLMMRHRTLRDTNTTLVQNLNSMADELEQKKAEYQDLQQEDGKMKMAINSQLSVKQKSQEVGVDKNQEREQKFLMDKIRIRQRRSEYGQIMMAIDNLAEKCKRHIDPELDSLDMEEKLVIIQRYITDKLGVAKLAQLEGGSPSTEKKSSPKRKRAIKQK